MRKVVTDGGDKFNTTTASICFNGTDLRLNLFTGAPTGNPIEDPKYPLNVHIGDADKYRLGALTLGYKAYRVGWNSEGIRHLAQNKFAHTIVKPHPWFKHLGGRGSYFGGSIANNPYSMWWF